MNHASPNRVPSTGFVLIALMLCIGKLVLIGTNEIIALPNDSVNFSRQATEALTEIGAASGYPYWLALSRAIGIPQRVAIELLYLIAALAAALSVVRVTGTTVVLCLFGVLAFLPATYFLFDNALNDGFYACLSLIALALCAASLVDLATQRLTSSVRIVALSLVFGWMLITRNEDYLLIAWILLFAACRFFVRKRAVAIGWATMESILIAAILLSGSFSVVWGVSTYHAITKGVFASTLATLPSHMTLLRNLAAIDTGASPILKVPITKAQRDAGYRVSPALRRLREHIEDPRDMFQAASVRAGFPQGEVGAGWIWHTFNTAALETLSNTSLKDLDGYYQTVNSELDRAFESGLLKKRFVIHPLVGAGAKNLLANFPGSMVKTYRITFEALGWQLDAGFEPKLFDLACLRRTFLVRAPGYTGLVQGWAFVDSPPNTSISSVDVGVYEAASGIGGAHWFATERMERRDVQRGLAAEGRGQVAVFGFRVDLASVRGDIAVVRYGLMDGTSVTGPVLVEVGKVVQIQLDSPGGFIEQGIDSIGAVDQAHTPDRRHALQIWLLSSFSSVFKYIAAFVIGVAFVSAAVRRASGSRDPTDRPVLAVVFLLAGVLALRIVFYALVNAVGWGVDTRYMAATTVLLVVLLAVLASYPSNGLKQWRVALSTWRSRYGA